MPCSYFVIPCVKSFSRKSASAFKIVLSAKPKSAIPPSATPIFRKYKPSKILEIVRVLLFNFRLFKFFSINKRVGIWIKNF